MDPLQSMKIYVQVAQRASFAASARELRLSPGAVTKHIAALEARLGTRLLDRTTRQVSMTESGRVYLERCIECLRAFEDADTCATELAKEPRGRLRITAPIDFQPQLSEILAPFSRAHPKIMLDVQLSNRSVNLVEEGIDLAIRCAPSLEGQFVARSVALVSMMIWGSPDYFRRHGRPKRPEDLLSHRTIVFGEPRPFTSITLTRGDEKVPITVDPIMISNSGGALIAAIREGLGICWSPSFLTHSDALRGAIEPVLIDWTMTPWKIFAIYPHRRFLAPAVRALVDVLRTTWGDGTRDPWITTCATAAPRRPERPRARASRSGAGR